MISHPLSQIAALLLLTTALSATGAMAQKHVKKTGTRARHTHHTVATTPEAPAPPATPVPDISVAPPSEVIPQQSSLTPEFRKTKKVAIVPAPPPPPGNNVVPPPLTPR